MLFLSLSLAEAFEGKKKAGVTMALADIIVWGSDL